MKDVTSAVTTTGNITNPGHAMTIDSGAIGKLMSMFSNQYSNAALAVVREYFCNGDDARIEAGSDRPTEVRLPTEINPVLQVRDYGIGLDKDGLIHTFGTYGRSTKDQSNDQTGGFGIGSKAAFTLGQQFVVTGYKDGHQTTALFALDARGIGQITIQFEGPTSEPNGVLVDVGVPDVSAMVRSANEFFLTVPKGRALVDGEPPVHLFDTVEHTRFNEEVVLVKDDRGQVRVQMGPVVYPVSRDILRSVSARLDGLPSQEVALALVNWSSRDSVLMEVAMGDVAIAPSREDLRDTETTVNRLAATVQGIADFIHNDIQAQIDRAPSRYQAALVLRSALADLKGFNVRRSTFTYSGVADAFKKEVKVPLPMFHLTKRSYRSQAMVVAKEAEHVVDFERADKTLVVTGVKPDDTGKVGRYAKRFLEARDDLTWIVVSEETTGTFEWFEFGTATGAETMTLDEYRATLRQMRSTDPRMRTEPAYSTGWRCGNASRDLDERDLLSDILSWGKPVVIQHGRVYVGEQSAYDILDAAYTVVVLLPQQSEDMLRKRIEADGTVEVFDGNYRDIVAQHVKASVAPPTEAERVAYGATIWVQHNWRENWAQTLQKGLSEEDFARITNPVVQRTLDAPALAALTAADLPPARKNDLDRLATWGGVEFTAIPYEDEDEVDDVTKAFPLLIHGIDSYRLRRLASYRNALIDYINSQA